MKELSVGYELTGIARELSSPGCVVLSFATEPYAMPPELGPRGMLTIVVDAESEAASLPLGAKFDGNLTAIKG